MAIGTAIGAAVGIGGALLGASATKKAASKAADTSLAVAEKNNALAREIYTQNNALLQPYNYRGNAAGDAINALLGLPTSADMPKPTPNALAPQGTTPTATPNALGQPTGWASIIFPNGYPNTGGTTAPTAPQTPNALAAPQTSSADILSRQRSAFDRFRDSTGYQFRLNEGMDAINSGYAANGLLQSGAAQKALLKYGQDYGSNEFGNYMGYLSNQQGVGLSGASAVAGVGQNYVNSVTANNNAAGTATANAALARGSATANMYGGIANSLGGLFGSSSYGWN